MRLEVRKIYEDTRVLAFHHQDPEAEGHVVPKKHVSSLLDAEALDGELLAAMAAAVQRVARTLGLDRTGSTSGPMQLHLT